MKAFTHISPAITDCAALLTRLRAADVPRVKGQTGFALNNVPGIEKYFASATALVSRHFGRKMYLRLARSSYREQLPDGTSALALHQDFDALTEMRKQRGVWINFGLHEHNRKAWLRSYIWPVVAPSDPGSEDCCTVWCPLVDIDEATPSLELSPQLPLDRVDMVGDANGYSVVVDQKPFQNWPLVALTRLKAGDAVIMSPLTLHRSYVRPWHTRTRYSVDLRFFSKEAEL